MTAQTTDKYSAGEQGLGYIYQARLALLHLLQLSVVGQFEIETSAFLAKRKAVKSEHPSLVHW